jgi:nicotinamidase-related amidase
MRKQLFVFLVMAAVGTVCLGGQAYAGNIIEEWGSVKIPPPPVLKQVVVDLKTTALLLLDFNKQPCNPDTRPRCIASIPGVKKLLTQARAKKMMVVYSITAGSTAADIPAILAPAVGDPVVKSGPDKFLGTDLEKILKERKIETVIVTGTASHGAIINTASGAAFRGMNVIVPVDAVSADDLYPEQYTVWHLLNAPRVSAKTTITTIDMIRF